MEVPECPDSALAASWGSDRESSKINTATPVPPFHQALNGTGLQTCTMQRVEYRLQMKVAVFKINKKVPTASKTSAGDS